MRNIARLSSADRRALFTNTASRTGMTTAIVEKDFWVCWTLDYLFHQCKWEENLAFKGGTSLSKAYHIIERFSEDIDLVLDWRVLGYKADEPWLQRSKTQQDKFNKEANDRTVEFLRTEFVPSIQSDIVSELGIDVAIMPDAADGQTILFAYPQDYADQTILQEIRLEIGALATWTPAAPKEITPYAAEQYMNLFLQPTTSILTVLPERTFWEKVTILHHEANRPANSMMPQRYSRHYYDLYCLADSWVKDASFANLGLLKQVVDFKDKFYPRSWAGYEYAVPGTMKLRPPNHCLKTLEDDYEHMRGMIFGKMPDFATLMNRIIILEGEINCLPV